MLLVKRISPVAQLSLIPGTRECLQVPIQPTEAAGETAAGAIYQLGLALFDLHTPEHCLKRSDKWFFGPEESYELQGM